MFDLDPGPEVAFTAVISAAKEVRDRLEELGLVSFCKTTGGKGLHVVTPLERSEKGNPSWAETKAFAQAVCQAMAKAAPDRYVINMAKKLRTGKIFLDYLRNDRLATAVAPLSPRVRAGATVSMPLTWAQVKPGLDPLAYTVRSVPGLLGKTKAWGGVLRVRMPRWPRRSSVWRGGRQRQSGEAREAGRGGRPGRPLYPSVIELRWMQGLRHGTCAVGHARGTP